MRGLPNLNLSGTLIWNLLYNITHEMTSHLTHRASWATRSSWAQWHQPCWRWTGTVASHAASPCQPAGTAVKSLHVWTFWSEWDQQPGRTERKKSFKTSKRVVNKWKMAVFYFGMAISFSKRAFIACKNSWTEAKFGLSIQTHPGWLFFPHDVNAQRASSWQLAWACHTEKSMNWKCTQWCQTDQ